MSNDLNTPWRVDYGCGDWGMPITHTIYDSNNMVVCEIYSAQPYCMGASPETIAKYKLDKEHAAHIVKCVNSHDALVEVLQGFVDNDDTPEPNCSCHVSPPCGDCSDYSEQRELVAAAKAALTAAQGDGK